MRLGIGQKKNPTMANKNLIRRRHTQKSVLVYSLFPRSFGEYQYFKISGCVYLLLSLAP